MKDHAELSGMRAALTLDPEAVLIRDPGLLLDPTFLGALHQDLRGRLGAQEAGISLLQIGFLHGLRDAARVVGGALDGPQAVPGLATATLPLRFRRNADSSPPGSVELLGCWPEEQEAAARLSLPREARGGACWLSAGYTSGWLSGIFEADVLAQETCCVAGGDESCRFVAREASVWRAAGNSRTEQMLEALPFEALRELVRNERSEPAPQAVSSEEPVIHIWGPVMVIPFAGVDEALMAVDLMGRDPEAAAVSVIVIDLTGAVIDEAFGAAALEQILESVEGWGAEAIFAGVSSLSEPTVAGLDRQPVMIQKDLHGAIASAFQIAESQRRSV